jgi:hypothetical protein
MYRYNNTQTLLKCLPWKLILVKFYLNWSVHEAMTCRITRFQDGGSLSNYITIFLAEGIWKVHIFRHLFVCFQSSVYTLVAVLYFKIKRYYHCYFFNYASVGVDLISIQLSVHTRFLNNIRDFYSILFWYLMTATKKI